VLVRETNIEMWTECMINIVSKMNERERSCGMITVTGHRTCVI